MRSVYGLRMEDEQVDRIDDKASKFGMNRSELMRHAIFIGLEVLESEN